VLIFPVILLNLLIHTTKSPLENPASKRISHIDPFCSIYHITAVLKIIVKIEKMIAVTFMECVLTIPYILLGFFFYTVSRWLLLLLLHNRRDIIEVYKICIPDSRSQSL
jgi:hypothetical protein